MHRKIVFRARKRRLKAVLQRVLEAKVLINSKEFSKINKGLLVFLCLEKGDDISLFKKFIDKIINLRIFEDSKGKMNLSVKDIGGEILVVSQFTLAADCRKGRRPYFGQAMEIEKAKEYFDRFVEILKEVYTPEKIFHGKFQANMQVYLINDGPVTIILDSREIC